MAGPQFDDTIRNGVLEFIRDDIGASPKLRLLDGIKPADTAAAQDGVLVAEISLPATWLDAAADGEISKLGTWTAAAVADGTIRYWRIMNTAGTVCRSQGSVTQAITLLTTAATAVGGNVITVADTTGIVTGMGVSGAGVPAGATVFGVTGGTVTFTGASSGIASGAPVTFGDTSGNLQLTSVAYSNGDGVVIDAFRWICPGA